MKKQRSDLVAGLFFNEGILSEILSWLEVKYVLRCKLVCKFWYAIVNNKQFVDIHMSHNGRLSFYYIKRKGENLFSFYYIKRKGENFEIESINSDGTKENIRYIYCPGFLIAEKSSNSDKPSAKYQLSNPSTKSILDLPDPHNSARSMSIFHDSYTNSYYVFSVCVDQKNNKNCFELLDLGGQSNDPHPNANLCWRTLEIPEYDKLIRQQSYKLSYVLSKGILYILYLLEVGLSNPKIICYDLVKQQTCTILDMPDQNLCLNSTNVSFQPCRGKPAVIFVLEEKLNVWVLEDYKNQKWADMIQISLSFLKENLKKGIPKDIPRVSCNDNGEVSLLYKIKNSECGVVYNPKSKEWHETPSSHYKVQATLVSVKGMRPEEKEC